MKNKDLNISKSQLEVWEMKDKIYQSVENLSNKEALYKIMQDSAIATEKYLNEMTLNIK